MQGMETALALVVLVGVVAVVLRRFAGPATDDRVTLPASEVSASEEADLEELDDEDLGPDEAIAITSDGWAFLPQRDAVELVPPGEPEEDWQTSPGADPELAGSGGDPLNPRTRGRMRGWKPGEPLKRGDLIAARVRRGAPGVDPWRLEALGRDHEFLAWAFETPEAARGALEMVESRVVQAPRDAEGDPVPVGDEDFAVARRKKEQTEEELALEPGPEDDARETLG